LKENKDGQFVKDYSNWEDQIVKDETGYHVVQVDQHSRKVVISLGVYLFESVGEEKEGAYDVEIGKFIYWECHGYKY
jgi:hypothetical protein